MKVNRGWSEEAHYVPAKSGSRLIGLSLQSPPLWKVIHTGTRTAIETAVKHGFFTTNDPEYVDICEMLADISKDLRYNELHARFKGDKAFGADIARVVSNFLRFYLVSNILLPLLNRLTTVSLFVGAVSSLLQAI